MSNELTLDFFISKSSYTDPVDVKKLKFIFSALQGYTSARGIQIHDLKILEVGCGRGGIAVPVASLGCDVTAFDIDSDAIQYLKRHAASHDIQNLELRIDSAYTFSDTRIYDVVIASEVFSYFLEPSKMIENIKKGMKEGSYLILTTPNGFGPWQLKNRIDPRIQLKKSNLLRRLFGKQTHKKGDGKYHCRYYTLKELLKFFSGFSFELVMQGNSNSILSIFQAVRRSPFWGSLDTRLADKCPRWLVSGWYFVFELHPELFC